MPKYTYLVAVVLLAAGVSTTQALDNAWFELFGGPGTAVGGPGGSLDIYMDAGLDSGTFIIEYHFTDDEQYYGPGMAGWGFQLFGGVLNSNSITFADDPSGYPLSQSQGYHLDISDADPNDGTYSPMAHGHNGSAGHVFTFQLTIDKAPGGESITYVYGALNGMTSEWGPSWYGNYGPNDGVYGWISDNPNGLDNFPFPLISITHQAVPEPGTAILLGLGAMAALCRRRR